MTRGRTVLFLPGQQTIRPRQVSGGVELVERGLCQIQAVVVVVDVVMFVLVLSAAQDLFVGSMLPQEVEEVEAVEEDGWLPAVLF
jgi:hypothetical protein